MAICKIPGSVEVRGCQQATRGVGLTPRRVSAMAAAAILLLASRGVSWAQFVEPPVESRRLPPVAVEAAISQAVPALMTTPSTTMVARPNAVAIPSWDSVGSLNAAAAYQPSPGQPVVEPVEAPLPPSPPSVALPSVTPPRRYFSGYQMPPRSGHISTGNAPPVPAPPDPEELDSCNLIKQHRLAMVDLLGRNELLISAGTVSPVGDSVLDNHLLTGWGIQGMARHIWCSGTDTWVGFTEVGGGFWENGGNRSYVTTSGTLHDATTGNAAAITLDDFFQTTLRDLRRAAVNTAIGAYYMPARWQQHGVRGVQFNGRIGMTLGHARATYQQTPTGDLQALIADRLAQGSALSSLTFQSTASRSDTYFGLFTSGGVSFNRYNVNWGCFGLSEVAVGVDLVYSHDFINLRSYNAASKGLSTLAPMATLRILY